MNGNPLRKLDRLGQSLWLDYIRRDLMTSGGLRRLIEEDGLRGMTSNPAIFEKAIADGHEYDDDIRALALQGKDAHDIYVKYVEALIGPDTVNTVPWETLNAYRDHGAPQARFETEVAQAARVLKRLSKLGITLEHVTQQLEDEGVAKFNQPFDKLMTTLTQRAAPLPGGARTTQVDGRG